MELPKISSKSSSQPYSPSKKLDRIFEKTKLLTSSYRNDLLRPDDYITYQKELKHSKNLEPLKKEPELHNNSKMTIAENTGMLQTLKVSADWNATEKQVYSEVIQNRYLSSNTKYPFPLCARSMVGRQIKERDDLKEKMNVTGLIKSNYRFHGTSLRELRVPYRGALDRKKNSSTSDPF